MNLRRQFQRKHETRMAFKGECLKPEAANANRALVNEVTQLL